MTFEMSLLSLARTLRALPPHRRHMLVVRSMPFGDLIFDDTQKVAFTAPPDCDPWRDWSYRLCRLAKRTKVTE